MTPNDPSPLPPGRDEAEKHFWIINMVRLMGVGFVILGLLMATGKLFPQVPFWVGYILVANGLVDVFIIPVMLARKWRSPN